MDVCERSVGLTVRMGKAILLIILNLRCLLRFLDDASEEPRYPDQDADHVEVEKAVYNAHDTSDFWHDADWA